MFDIAVRPSEKIVTSLDTEVKKARKNIMIIIPHLIALIVLQTGMAAGADCLDGVLKGIKERYGDLPGLEVDYSRDVVTRSMRMLGDGVREDAATGTISFKPPYSFRLEQKTPRPETLIANEDRVWWYIPEKKLVHLLPPEEFGNELKLLSDIFRGLVRVEERFRVALAAPKDERNHTIELTPDPPWQEIEKIILTASSDYEIKEVEIYNMVGGITYFKLWNLVVRKQEWGPDQFRFVIPEGVEVKGTESNAP